MTIPSVGRRVFVRAGGLALVSLGLDPVFLTRAAYAATRRATTGRPKTLVCVFQRGAVDGLSMVAPYGDRFYASERPRIALSPPGRPDGVIDLDGHFGLHPSLESLHPFYEAGALAVVHAVGSPDTTRSHFDAQDYMESGTPGVKSTRDGWLNRHMHAVAHRDTPFRGVAVDEQLPRSLRGAAPALAIENLESFGLRGRAPVRDRLTSAFEDLYRGSATGVVAASSSEGFEAIRLLQSIDHSQYRPANDARYPSSRFGGAMRQTAQLVKADLGVEIAFVDVGGWDTHVNQGGAQGQLATRLSDFSGALAAFAHDLGDRLADVVVLTMSEFGRTVAENGNRGTDHGRATAMLVLGGNTSGGQILGDWPTLDPAARFEGRDLAVTTDFRDLFGEILVRHLGASDLQAVFPGFRSDPTRWTGVLA